MHAHEKHRAVSPKTLRIGVITVSTSRFHEKQEKGSTDDESGAKAVELIKKAGHTVTSVKIVDDDKEMIRNELLKTLNQDDSNVAILTGGTGLAKRDVTIETVLPMFEKIIDGFGEIFRHFSYEKIGPPAFLTRATAGTINGKLVFCLPGSPHAVETGMNLLLPELPHAAFIAHS